VRQTSEVSSLKEMQGRPIGVPYGFAANFNSVRSPGVNIYDLALVHYNNMNRAFDDLSNDHIDGVIIDAISAYALTKGLHAGKLKVVTAPLTDEGLRIASLKSSASEDIINLINESIDKMRQDGTYQTLIDKWNLIDPQTQFNKP
jgi:ABC-type amino acid transport substrate-binding protein